MKRLFRYTLITIVSAVGLMLWALSGEVGKLVGKSAFDRYREGQREGLVEQAQAVAANELRKQLPIFVDELTILQTVLSSGKALLYFYIVNLDINEFDLDEFNKGMKHKLVSSACNNENMRYAMENGGNYIYIYSDHKGLEFSRLLISESDCK